MKEIGKEKGKVLHLGRRPRPIKCLSGFYVPGTNLGCGDRKTDERYSSCLHGTCVLMGKAKRSSRKQGQNAAQPRIQRWGVGEVTSWWALDNYLGFYLMGKENPLNGFGQ